MCLLDGTPCTAIGSWICKICISLPFYHPREDTSPQRQEATAGLVWLPPAYLTGQYLQPLDMILGLLGNELDALKDIGDVIDAPFLHFEHLSRPVQVNNPIS